MTSERAPGSPPSAPRAGGGGGWLVLALALGLVRFVRLGQWSLWIDEAFTLADAYHGQWNYNPLGYAVIRAVVEASGAPATELTLRLAPAVAGWLAIPLVFWAFVPVAGGRVAGAAALVVAASPWQVYWSQNARFYTFVTAVGLVALGLVARGLVRGSRPLACAGLVVASAGVVLHLQAALLAASIAAAVVVAPWTRDGAVERTDVRRLARTVAIAGGVLALAGSPWVYRVFDYYRYLKPAAPLASIAHLAKSTGFFLTPTLCVAAAVGAGVVLTRRTPLGRFALATLAVGVAGGTTAAALATGSAQYVFAFMPLVALLAAWPLAVSPLRGSRAASTAWLALLVLPLLAETGLYLTVRHGERPRWREAYGWVAEHRGPNDLVLGMQASVGEFYLNPGATDLRRPRTVAWTDRNDPGTWQRWAMRRRPLWVVVRPDFLQLWPGDMRRNFRAFLTDECHLKRRFDVHLEGRDLDLEVYYRP